MDQSRFFESVIEPSAERLELFGIAHEINFDRRNFIVTHKISKNVFTAFDTRLSRYLAAVRGGGLPQGTVETRIRDVASGRAWTPYPPRHCASMPAALATAAKLALGSAQQIAVRMGAWMSQEALLDLERVITIDTVRSMEHALGVCDRIGPPEFLEISGDLDRVVVRPAGSRLDLMVMDLHRGTVAVPGLAETGGTAHQAALYGFADAIRNVPAVSAYMSRAQHAVALAKEETIHQFRQSAEERIIQLNTALANRPLAGYRMEAASSLVARLQAGLGLSLVGLNEAAQITALDWAAMIRGDLAPPGLPGEQDDNDGNGSQPRLVG